MIGLMLTDVAGARIHSFSSQPTADPPISAQSVLVYMSAPFLSSNPLRQKCALGKSCWYVHMESCRLFISKSMSASLIELSKKCVPAPE